MNKFLQILSGLFFAFTLFASAANPNVPGWAVFLGAVLGLGGYIFFGVLARHE